ncbi:putative amidohydrolase [Escovopsis weberi]|uniref:Putative amidohydrolase n=1 Tax=Escovopsis weberi TaxID=150374 RepID=A0A0M8N5E6_ESCWE|nr:putative amidohydrolase [Escovopsis weberi]
MAFPSLSLVVMWTAVVTLIAAVGLALSVQLQQPLLRPLSASSSSSSSSSTSSSTSTFCYAGLRTNERPEDGHRDEGGDPLPSSRCFSVADGLVTRVWTDREALPLEDAVRSDGYAIPGLWDGHGHLAQYGELLDSVDLFGSQSVEEALARIRRYLADDPGAGSSDNWLRGVGWDQNTYGRMPTAHDLEGDEQLAGLYVMIDRIDIHCTWVSQAVLDLLPADIPDVPGGEVIREPGYGVFCDNAMDMVLAHWPAPGPHKKADQVRKAMASLNEVGLVGMHDAGQYPAQSRLYAQLAASADDWTVRVYGMLLCDAKNTFCLPDAARVERDDHRLVVRSVKLFADGALGSWGSALLEPYSDRPSTSGSLLINASALTAVAKAWAAEGYQVNIHAIGDLANRNAIDALEAALLHECPGQDPARCQATRRFRLEHAQVVHPLDQQRMRALGLIPSIQPTHATSDMTYAEDRLGPARTAEEAYRMRSVLGLNPVLGSDFPVEPPNPFHGIYAAVTRRSPRTGLGPDPRHPERGWHTEEALTLDEAFWGFTGGAAHGAFLEGKAGVIREGAFADWVVLDEPLEGIDIERLRDLRRSPRRASATQTDKNPHAHAHADTASSATFTAVDDDNEPPEKCASNKPQKPRRRRLTKPRPGEARARASTRARAVSDSRCALVDIDDLRRIALGGGGGGGGAEREMVVHGHEWAEDEAQDEVQDIKGPAARVRALPRSKSLDLRGATTSSAMDADAPTIVADAEVEGPEKVAGGEGLGEVAEGAGARPGQGRVFLGHSLDGLVDLCHDRLDRLALSAQGLHFPGRLSQRARRRARGARGDDGGAGAGDHDNGERSGTAQDGDHGADGEAEAVCGPGEARDGASCEITQRALEV